MATLKLTKTDAARRQLETALDLYFASGDLVAVWTLGAAAYNLLRDLGKSSGSSPMLLKEQLPTIVPPELKRVLINKIQETENFLKHADRDPDTKLEFMPNGRIELLLFDAALKYRELLGTETPLMVLIRMWFLSKAMITHDGGNYFDGWLEAIRPMTDEPPRAYRERMWPEAVRLGHGLSAEQSDPRETSA